MEQWQDCQKARALVAQDYFGKLSERFNCWLEDSRNLTRFYERGFPDSDDESESGKEYNEELAKPCYVLRQPETMPPMCQKDLLQHMH